MICNWYNEDISGQEKKKVHQSNKNWKQHGLYLSTHYTCVAAFSLKVSRPLLWGSWSVDLSILFFFLTDCICCNCLNYYYNYHTFFFFSLLLYLFIKHCSSYCYDDCYYCYIYWRQYRRGKVKAVLITLYTILFCPLVPNKAVKSSPKVNAVGRVLVHKTKLYCMFFF